MNGPIESSGRFIVAVRSGNTLCEKKRFLEGGGSDENGQVRSSLSPILPIHYCGFDNQPV